MQDVLLYRLTPHPPRSRVDSVCKVIRVVFPRGQRYRGPCGPSNSAVYPARRFTACPCRIGVFTSLNAGPFGIFLAFESQRGKTKPTYAHSSLSSLLKLTPQLLKGEPRIHRAPHILPYDAFRLARNDKRFTPPTGA